MLITGGLFCAAGLDSVHICGLLQRYESSTHSEISGNQLNTSIAKHITDSQQQLIAVSWRGCVTSCAGVLSSHTNSPTHIPQNLHIDCPSFVCDMNIATEEDSEQRFLSAFCHGLGGLMTRKAIDISESCDQSINRWRFWSQCLLASMCLSPLSSHLLSLFAYCLCLTSSHPMERCKHRNGCMPLEIARCGEARLSTPVGKAFDNAHNPCHIGHQCWSAASNVRCFHHLLSSI